MATKEIRLMKNDTLGRERRNSLKDRITQVSPYIIPLSKDTPAISKMREALKKFDVARNKIRDKKREACKKAQSKAFIDVLATDSFDEGLKIVEQYEALAKRQGWVEKEDESLF